VFLGVLGVVVVFALLGSRGTKRPTSPVIMVRGADVIYSEALLDHTKYSWQASFKNPSERPVMFVAYFRMLDRAEFELDKTIEPELFLEAGEEKMMSGQGIMKTDNFRKVTHYDVQTRVR
jgi:hypothetical protein